MFENYVDGNAQPFQFWDTALSYVAEKQKGERIILAIDDVDKLAARDLMLPKVLAHAIDNVLETSDIFLIAACADDSAITQGELKERISKTVRIESFLNEKTINALQKEELKRTKILTFITLPPDTIIFFTILPLPLRPFLISFFRPPVPVLLKVRLLTIKCLLSLFLSLPLCHPLFPFLSYLFFLLLCFCFSRNPT